MIARAMSRRFLLLLLVFLAVPAAAKRRAAHKPELYPRCTMVAGTGAVTFTHDEGRTLAPTAERITPVGYTWGVAALDENDTLLAWHKDALLISTDAGCSWRVAATIPGSDFPPTLTPAKGGRAYAWSENRKFFVRYDARGAKLLKQPVDFMGIGVDRNDADRVRAGGNDGTVWETTDGGESWTQTGALTGPAMVYRFAFDPQDLDHIVAGTMVEGAFVSRDGGRTWTRAELGTRSANVFQLVFSPVDSDRVWAMGIDMQTLGRHIYASDDGGATYRIIVTEQPGVKLINGPIMAAHPKKREVLYFIFGTWTFDYGTDVFRYDHSTGTLRVQHNDQQGVNAIAFSKKHPEVMYLGLERVK